MLAAGLVALTPVLIAGAYWFQPWKLWQDDRVHEAFPTAPASRGDAARSSAPGATGGPAAPAGPKAVARGDLISHEHATTGTVRLVRLPDGSHLLRLENLDTSNGPDLRVWLTDAPVKEGTPGWRVFDDGRYVSLGRLKGNKGDQNYPVPAGVDIADYSSVTIWCDRFDVSFGAAELGAV
ncbi:DM13 domain-containing protein [Streptomyces sp. NBC_00691]|uniref:DM13 domain-containing protein n=1 Tax=Streptomyces sp. NBC_00691 TaxID=2903671 RepID=UPI002E37A467|nr:DM13 domain-containing protein [Streptomyces sp. NBC_00691]